MRVLPVLLAALVAATAVSCRGAGDAPPREVPVERALYADGASGRHLLDLGWTSRADRGDVGLRRGWQRPGRSAGFRPVEVPDSFNADDLTARGFRSWVQWYRVPFRLPQARGATGWRLRFESVNRRATVFLNGVRIGDHEGAHLPFELPATGLRPGRNELVVRVDGRPGRSDLPPSTRPRGWWNFGGLLREVYLRRVSAFDLADLDARAEPAGPTRAGRVRVAAVARNTTGRALPLDYSVDLTDPSGRARTERVRGSRAVRAGGLQRITTEVAVPAPLLWSPERPALYRVRVRVRGGQVTQAHVGFRTFSRDRRGRALLNGRPLSLRGASLHEYEEGRGAALSAGDRARRVVDLEALGANFARQHYPPHPALLEAFDRRGIVFWEQVPVWRLRAGDLARPALREQALRRLREAVVRDRNHASVMTWSAANETLAGGAPEVAYLREAKRLVRRLDPSRFFAVDTSLRPLEDIPAAYRELDALGVNEYVGWYGEAPTSELRSDLGELRRRFPRLALFVTEFGAEANRTGRGSEKGTFAFQSAFLDQHLAIIDASPTIGGALVWILRDFPVRPGWVGGNPRPDPPFLRKGLLDEDGVRKPAFEGVRERLRRTPATRAPFDADQLTP